MALSVVDERKIGPGECVIRIDRNRALVEFDGARVPVGVSPASLIPAPQIRIVRLGVPRLAATEAGRAVGRQPEPDLLRDSRTQFLLKPEQAGGLTLVRLQTTRAPDPVHVSTSR